MRHLDQPTVMHPPDATASQYWLGAWCYPQPDTGEPVPCIILRQRAEVRRPVTVLKEDPRRPGVMRSVRELVPGCYVEAVAFTPGPELVSFCLEEHTLVREADSPAAG